MALRVSSDFRVYSFSKHHKPVLSVKPGSVVVFETRDAFDRQLSLEVGRPLEVEKVDRSRCNPATGPVWVEGAKPGQTLEVEILGIRVADRGFIGRRVFRIVDGEIDLGFMRIPVKPVIGVIGVAPAEGDIGSRIPGDHGGNLDEPRVTVGSRVFLPVWVEGALLGIGDVHAAQGDGEVSGQGLEVSAEVEVRLRLHPGRVVDRVLVDSGDELLVLASSESLETAVREVTEAAQMLLMKALGVDGETALALLSLTSNLGVSQIVNPRKTAKFTIPKRLLGVGLEVLLKNP